jgi:hemerythrin
MVQNLFIIWKDDYNSEIPIIDEQHRGIVSTINTLYYFIQEGKGADALKPSLQALEYYVTTHFQTEEELLRKTDFPELESHLQLHNDMKQNKDRIAKEVAENDDPVILLKFLKEWISDHLINEDSKYVPYLKALMNSEK